MRCRCRRTWGLLGVVQAGSLGAGVRARACASEAADWLIDIGPEGGKHGGMIVAEGTPEVIVKSKKSLTGKFLKKEL